MKPKSHNTPGATPGTWYRGEDGKLYFQCEVHREAEMQLILALVPAECRERISAGLAALREEFTD